MKIAVLLSGSGRTLDNFHEKIAAGLLNASIEVVVSNVVSALGLTKARQYGYPAFPSRSNKETNDILSNYDVELVCLAGYLKLYKPLPQWARRVLNIHPALIPSFCGPGYYGMHVHRAVLKRGVKVSGCTVHFANEVYDEGPIVVQQCVPVFDDDSPETIAGRVFDSECIAYPEAINLIAEKGVDYYWRNLS
ncbi:MAG: phosphoribosylglycinamide formyltransferase [Deltaproteobacteria bacterium RIFOXYD12_FULL_50_9]|nr:MAG: phosphoribosylglycinamide formyltransferase [Deltaproteobacteria bacterium RIFOXYD12_FULL_50_9]